MRVDLEDAPPSPRCGVCGATTREGKPFCPDHVDHMPYAQEIAARAEEEARLIKAGRETPPEIDMAIESEKPMKTGPKSGWLLDLTGEKVRAWRTRHGLTKGELGLLIGSAGGAVDRWERGHGAPLAETQTKLRKLIAAPPPQAMPLSPPAPPTVVWLPGLSPSLVKEWRRASRTTQEELARALRVARGTVISWESGATVPRQDVQTALLAMFADRDLKPANVTDRDIKPDKTVADRDLKPDTPTPTEKPMEIPPVQPVQELKTWPEPFRAIVDRTKRCEVRYELDRTFAVGGLLELREFVPDEGYTGRRAHVAVTHLQRGFGLPAGLVVLSIELRTVLGEVARGA